MSVKIASLELENVKRVSLVSLEPSKTGLTVIGGDNAQGKTSILDAIVYALGGEKYRPSELQRRGSVADARISVTLSNGLLVERKGKNSALKVSDPSGRKGGQRLLDSFVEELALNLPKFIAAKNSEKAQTLLKIIGIESELEKLDREERKVVEERLIVGRTADQKEKYAAELPEHHDVPDELVSAADLIRESQEILARNGHRDHLRRELSSLVNRRTELGERIAECQKRLQEYQTELSGIETKYQEARKTPIQEDESTAEIQEKIENIEVINAKIRENKNKENALADAQEYRAKYNALTLEVEKVRKNRLELLSGAKMPLPGLSIGKDEKDSPILTYNGLPWDCMSSMEQYRVAVAIVRELNPECGFVLIDGLEAFDLHQLEEFGEWLNAEGLQAIATRVSRGEECTIIIEDGAIAGAPETVIEQTIENRIETEPKELEEW